YAYTVLRANEANKRNAMTIQVTARQFAFEFTYPRQNGKTVVSPILYLPKGKPGLQAPFAGRGAQLLCAELRREARRGPRNHDDSARDPGQDRQLSGRVHRVVRPRPLLHARPGPGRRPLGLPDVVLEAAK